MEAWPAHYLLTVAPILSAASTSLRPSAGESNIKYNNSSAAIPYQSNSQKRGLSEERDDM
jgi:hypothetical protein